MKKETNLSLHGLCMAANFQRINIDKCVYEGYAVIFQHPKETVSLTVVDDWGNEYKVKFEDLDQFRQLVLRAGYADRMDSLKGFEIDVKDSRPPYFKRTERLNLWEMVQKYQNDKRFCASVLIEHWKSEGVSISPKDRIAAAREMMEAAEKELYAARIDRMIEMGFYIGCELDYKGIWKVAKGKKITITKWRPSTFGFYAQVEGLANTVDINGAKQLRIYQKQLQQVAVAA